MYLYVSIAIGIFYAFLQIFFLEVYNFETIVNMAMQISIVITGSFFTLNLLKDMRVRDRLWTLATISVLVVVTSVYFLKYPYYRIFYIFTTIILVINLYLVIMYIFSKILKRDILFFLISSILLGGYIIGVKIYTEKYIKPDYSHNESLKEIYIEAGSVIERKHTMKLLERVPSCDTFKQIIKKRIELDKKLLKNAMFKKIIEERNIDN